MNRRSAVKDGQHKARIGREMMDGHEIMDRYEIMDRVLEDMKKEFADSVSENGHIAFDFLRNEKIYGTRLYDFVTKMPKGAEDHVHGMALLPARELTEFAASLKGLYISTDKDRAGYLSRQKQSDEFCLLGDALRDGLYLPDELVRMWSLEGAGIGGDLWTYMEKLFDAHAILGDDDEYVVEYYRKAFEYYISNNVDHVEIRTFFFGDRETAIRKAKAIRQAYYDTREKYPDFSAKIIALTLKYRTIPDEIIKMLTVNACEAASEVMDESEPCQVTPFIVGFDIVNEEDKSRSLAEMEDITSYVKEKAPDLKFVFHAGETLRDDNDNIATAIKLGAVRIGHGFDLYKHEELKNKLRENDIALEVCPVSNHILGYCEDLRTHPAKEYLREGISILISSDDPAYLEHTSLVDDYVAVIMNWDLSIRDIKELSMNSIRYCLADEKTKKKLMENLEIKWNSFFDMYCKKEARGKYGNKMEQLLTCIANKEH